MVLFYHSKTWYQLSFITIYPCKWTTIVGPTCCKLWDCSSPIQLYTVQLYTAGFGLNWTCKLAVTRSIMTCSWLYNLQDFPLVFVIIFLTIPPQQVMAPGILQPGAIEAELSWTTGGSNNAPPSETQQQLRHQLVHRDAAIVATENMTQDAHLRIVRQTGSSKNTKQHAIRCDSIYIDVDDGQQTV